MQNGDRGDVLVLILGTGANLKSFYANLRCLLDDMSKVVHYAKLDMHGIHRSASFFTDRCASGLVNLVASICNL